MAKLYPWIDDEYVPVVRETIKSVKEVQLSQDEINRLCMEGMQFGSAFANMLDQEDEMERDRR